MTKGNAVRVGRDKLVLSDLSIVSLAIRMERSAVESAVTGDAAATATTVRLVEEMRRRFEHYINDGDDLAIFGNAPVPLCALPERAPQGQPAAAPPVKASPAPRPKAKATTKRRATTQPVEGKRQRGRPKVAQQAADAKVVPLEPFRPMRRPAPSSMPFERTAFDPVEVALRAYGD